MEFPVTVSIDIKNEEDHKRLTTMLERVSCCNSTTTEEKELLEQFVIRPRDEIKQARVLISGTEITRGTRSDMKKRYDQEFAMHQNSTITLQEMIDGEWKMVQRTRRVH